MVSNFDIFDFALFEADMQAIRHLINETPVSVIFAGKLQTKVFWTATCLTSKKGAKMRLVLKSQLIGYLQHGK